MCAIFWFATYFARFGTAVEYNPAQSPSKPPTIFLCPRLAKSVKVDFLDRPTDHNRSSLNIVQPSHLNHPR